MAWQMRDIVGILLVAFTINSAALFVPTIAMISSRTANTSAAFWSMTLALVTVIAWYAASAMQLAPVFSIDPLWPGLIVSIAVFTGIGLVAEARR
jgi:Na+/pantothenate symporter